MTSLYFIVDDLASEIEYKSVNPMSRLDEMLIDRIAVDLDALKDKIQEVIRQIDGMLPRSIGEESCFEVASATFTLKISSQGEVSIFSMGKASIGSQSGIQITLNRKRNL
ncbi:MAG: hypothetical protein SWE60_01860 [Thermodesulfobacteriota bacterium]|nr:hypothetical protein [Thermodesulfobacteriota bacterium]